MRRTLAVAALIAGVLMLLPAAAGARTRFDTQLLARIPPPGFPAFAYVHPNGRIYEGTYSNPSGDSQRSRVLEYDSDGTLLRSWTVTGQDLTQEHGVQVATSDRQGRLILLDIHPARALILDPRLGTFQQYATFPDLPACPGGLVQPGCTPTLGDREPQPNYAAWGPDGSLYVTDFLQGVIWRVPKGGGTAQVWLSDRRLDGGEFGTTGIVLGADKRTLFFAQGSSAGLGGLNPTTGKLYSVPINPDGSPGAVTQIWESGPADLPDGFAIARSGNFYVPLAGGANQIAVVAPDGHEVQRFPSAAGGGDNGSGTPFDTPSSTRFLGTRLIVANQSFTGTRANQVLLDVEAGEPGLPEFVFGLDRTPPKLGKVSLTKKRLHRRKGLRVRFRLNERATVTLRLDRRAGKAWRPVSAHVNHFAKGKRSFVIKKVKRAGRYRVRLRARDRAGNRSSQVARRFKVIR